MVALKLRGREFLKEWEQLRKLVQHAHECYANDEQPALTGSQAIAAFHRKYGEAAVHDLVEGLLINAEPF